MVIKESQMISKDTTVSSILNNINYLDESAAQYHAAMVPVVENSALEGYIVRLEDMVSFAEANGIEDLGYAVSAVCEASEIDPQHLIFSVQEDSIIGDPEIASLTSDIMNEGVAIVAVPLSDAHPVSQIVNEAMEYIFETGDLSIIDALCEMDIHDMNKQRKEAGLAPLKSDIDQHEDETGAADIKFKDKGSIEAEKNAADGIMAKAKLYAGKGRDFIAKYIAKLHDWARKINKKIHSVDPKERTILQSIQKKITGAIAWLTARLSKISTKNSGYSRNNPEYWNKGDKGEEKKA